MASQSYLTPLHLLANSKVIMENKHKSEYADGKGKSLPVSKITSQAAQT
jgi:hypothetical protein